MIISFREGAIDDGIIKLKTGQVVPLEIVSEVHHQKGSAVLLPVVSFKNNDQRFEFSFLKTQAKDAEILANYLLDDRLLALHRERNIDLIRSHAEQKQNADEERRRKLEETNKARQSRVEKMAKERQYQEAAAQLQRQQNRAKAQKEREERIIEGVVDNNTPLSNVTASQFVSLLANIGNYNDDLKETADDILLYEYTVVSIGEGWLGGERINEAEVAALLNRYARKGWRVVSMIPMSVWSLSQALGARQSQKEEIVITFERPVRM